MDRIVITDESLNSYGFRVLTSGAVLDRFMKNPVLLYDHQSWALPLGRWTDLSVEGNRITAVPEFDMEDEEAMKVAKKYEKKYLNSASIGFRILATSEAEEDMLPGQALPTVTKWELYEVSLTPIPANGNAIRLYDLEGNEVDLHDSAAIQLAFSQQNKKTVEDTNKEKLSFEQKALTWLFGKLGVKKEDVSAEEEAQHAENQQAQPEAPEAVQLSELTAQMEELNTQLTQKVDEITSLKAQYLEALNAKDQRIQELEAEVKKLSREAADEEADGKSEKDQRETNPADIMLPETLSAIEYLNRINPKKVNHGN